MERPDNDDFWLLAEIVQDLDAAAEDVGIERAMPVDFNSLAYVAAQRAFRLRCRDSEGVSLTAGLTVSWIDGFAAGLNFQKRRGSEPK